MRPTAAQENPARSSGNPGGPGRTRRGWPRPAPSFPPASPELVPGSGLREAPAISPCICQAPKTPSPVCLPVDLPQGCLSISDFGLPPVCPLVRLLFLPALGARGRFPQCGWWRSLAPGWAKGTPSWVTWSLALKWCALCPGGTDRLGQMVA